MSTGIQALNASYGLTGNDAFTTFAVDGRYGVADSIAFGQTAAHAATVTGTFATSTAVVPFGGAVSFSFNGTSYYSYANHVDFNPPGDFTVDWWVYLPGATTSQSFSFNWNGTTASIHAVVITGAMTFYMSSNGTSFDIANGLGIGTATAGAWTHFAVVRSGNTYTPYRNGVAGTTWSSAATPQTAGTNYIGSGAGSNNMPAGSYIADLRFSKTARWTAGFTPPVRPYG